ncbi:MAG TPA: GH1 family beta-glucosidase [Trueperaceae bacterium]
MRRLPADGFVWGAASSAYQVEGAVGEDGRSESIWDAFCRMPGAIDDGSDGSVACDSYHRWEEDVDLVAALGLDAYRFSIAWPRVQPGGRGRVNPAGLDYYERLVDGLLRRGLKPYATLYHWDLPLSLQEDGGWVDRDTSYAFADYAQAVAARLGDRVESYATLNEPWCSAFLGHGTGEHAPGERDPDRAQAAVHNLLLGHGLAMERLRAEAPRSALGIVLNFTPAYPADPEEPADVEAARRHDVANHQIFLGPLFRGAYPEEVEDRPASAAAHVQNGDLSVISAGMDYLGVNYYTRALVRHDPASPWPHAGWAEAAGRPKTDMGWEVFPAGLQELLVRLARETRLPLYVTENGAGFDEPAAVPDRGALDDTRRWDYLASHLAAVERAKDAGADVRGYFAWSLLDNFEWARGYTKRFGLVHVDFETQTRTPKLSAWRLAEHVAGSRKSPHTP